MTRQNLQYIAQQLGFVRQDLPVIRVYRTRAIISRSRFEAALVYKPRILSLKNEDFPFLVHKLSAIQAAAKMKIG